MGKSNYVTLTENKDVCVGCNSVFTSDANRFPIIAEEPPIIQSHVSGIVTRGHAIVVVNCGNQIILRGTGQTG